MGKRGSHLFVYGTLMPAAAGSLGKAQRERLSCEASFLSAATMTAARLYDLGRYPGLVESGAVDEIVHGAVLALADADRTFVWLDAYEGVVPGDPEMSDYARLERTVRLENGTELSAWVYVFLRDVTHRSAIASGRW